MIRRSGLNSQLHGFSNAVQQRGNTPASTLAAQIVDRISTTDRQRSSRTTESFEQLLLELNRNAASGNTTDTDIHVNCRLVYVVAEAGLKVLLEDNPFADQDLQISHASTVLTIIQLTIKRTPQILFLDLHDGSAAGIPLFLWLFPKLLAITGVQKYPTLQDKLAEVLFTLSSAKPVKSTLWPRFGPMFQCLQECTEGMKFSRLKELHAETSQS